MDRPDLVLDIPSLVLELLLLGPSPQALAALRQAMQSALGLMLHSAKGAACIEECVINLDTAVHVLEVC